MSNKKDCGCGPGTPVYQLSEVCRDFASYYDLYQKYQADYQVEAILRGESFDRMLAKVAHASFDERMSVVHLLLSGVRKAIRRAMEQGGRDGKGL